MKKNEQPNNKREEPVEQAIWAHIKKLKGYSDTANLVYQKYRPDIEMLAKIAGTEKLKTVLRACTEIAVWFETVRKFSGWAPKHIIEEFFIWQTNPQKYLPYEDVLDRMTRDSKFREKWAKAHKDDSAQEIAVTDGSKRFDELYFVKPEMFEEEK